LNFVSAVCIGCVYVRSYVHCHVIQKLFVSSVHYLPTNSKKIGIQWSSQDSRVHTKSWRSRFLALLVAVGFVLSCLLDLGAGVCVTLRITCCFPLHHKLLLLLLQDQEPLRRTVVSHYWCCCHVRVVKNRRVALF